MIRSQSQRAQLRGNDGEDDNLECKQTDPATHQYETNSRVHIEVLAGWCWGIHLSLCMSWSTPTSMLLVYPCKHASSSSACRMPGHLGMPTKWGHVGPLELNPASRFEPFSVWDLFLRICLFADFYTPTKPTMHGYHGYFENMTRGLNNIMFQFDQLADVALSGW